ncbi:hypothetical protein AVEN_263212-1 [Araneus ventricosus]|uniref:Uncharacterized protein n=1 Tax=Araneus ventricosus TaxID=182803 RepID=A0A4Y2LW11_ARAVE|nr:hypothetical protein AVEN_263212-1 [Araneus ventricosus]
MAEGVISGRGRDVSECKWEQIIGQFQMQKSYNERTEITSIYLRTVQRIMRSWKDVNEPTSSGKMCGRKTILNNHGRRSLKRLVKFIRQKSTLELTNSFDKGSKPSSTGTIRQ